MTTCIPQRKKLIELLATVLICAPYSFVMADTPVLTASNTQLSWAGSTARSVNIHSGDGGYITSLSGDATSWNAPNDGSYFIVLTTELDWSEWEKSNVVTVSSNENDAEVSDSDTGGNALSIEADGLTARWSSVTAASFNVYSTDRGYIDTVAGNSTHWTTNTTGDYYIVATTSGHWSEWVRSATVSLDGQFTQGTQDNETSVDLVNVSNARAILNGIGVVLNDKNIQNQFESTDIGQWMLYPRSTRGEVEGITFVSSTSSDESGGTLYEIAYTCDGGGELSIRYLNVGDDHNNRYEFSNCIAGGLQLDGVVDNDRFSDQFGSGSFNDSYYEDFRVYSGVSGQLLQAWTGDTQWYDNTNGNQISGANYWNFSQAQLQHDGDIIALTDLTRIPGRDNFSTVPLKAYEANSSIDGQGADIDLVKATFSLNSDFTMNASWTDSVDMQVSVRLSSNLAKLDGNDLTGGEGYPRTITTTDMCADGPYNECVSATSATYLVTDDADAIKQWQQMNVVVTANDGSRMEFVGRRLNGNEDGEFTAKVYQAGGGWIEVNVDEFPVSVNSFNVPDYNFWDGRYANDVWVIRD